MKAERIAALVIASAITALGVAMAAASALERSTQEHGRWLVTGTGIALALGAHMLPALARRLPAAWVLWAGCVLATLYSHAAFYTGAGQAAGDARAAAVAPSAQALALTAELASIPATSTTAAADALAKAIRKASQANAVLAKCKASCPLSTAAANSAKAQEQAARVALAQAERAAQVRQALASQAAAQDAHRASRSTTAVDLALATATGLSAQTVALATSILQSLLVECLAALLWLLAMPGQSTTTSRMQRTPRPALLTQVQSQVAAWHKRIISKAVPALLANASTRARPVQAPSARPGQTKHPPQRMNSAGKAQSPHKPL